ncbi:phage tail assembly protein [Hyphomicrobium sp.]|uniref:phage tail assembly protein n=1 Tax=Hyphomicrobium sp. TaxID=82 RepID=UPI001D778B84|nr:phage tail assembly protein [Hyphomicrobium sp.]MBY0559876.1 phage tail assembly protein [Hyphomicrobium sp.]
MSHPHQPGSGRQPAPHQGGFVPSPPQPAQGFIPQAQPPKMPPPPLSATHAPVAHEQVSDFGEKRDFKPGSAADQLARAAASKAAIDATQGNPAPAQSPFAQADPSKPYVFTFSYPIDNGGKDPITTVTFKRPKWSDFQKAMRHRLVLSGEMTDNDALISAVTGLSMELLPDIDGFDGARLLIEVQNFFLTDPMVKLSAT